MAVICGSLTGYSQEWFWDERYIDSIMPRLENIKADRNAVDQLRKLADMHISRNPDSTILFADRGDSIAEAIHYYEAQVMCLATSAIAHNIRGNWAAATLKMNKALPICQQHEPDLLLLVYNIMFAISGIKGEFEMLAPWKDKQLRALENYSGPDWVKWPTYMQLTIFYNKSGQFDSVRFYADSLKVYLNKYGDIQGLKRDSYMVLGTLALTSGDKDLALQYFRLGPYPLGIAQIYKSLGNQDSTIFYAEKELQIWTRLKSPHGIMPPAEILAEVYDSINPSESNKYLKIYKSALASFYNTDKQLAQVRLNQERLENELQSRDAENRNKISMIVAAAIVTLLGGFSFLLWRNNRFKQKANKKLEASYKELKSTQAQLIQSEKMASLGELTAGIAHEIQNPLNFVNNFSEVNAELLQEMKQGIKAGNYPEVSHIAEDLESNMEKISHHGKRADAIVKSMLQHSRTSSGQKEATDINELADEYLRLSYHGIRAKDKSFNATLQTDFDETIGQINIIPQDIGRVLLNIYNNAFYAVTERKREQPEGYEATVQVTTRLVDEEGNSVSKESVNPLRAVRQGNSQSAITEARSRGVPQSVIITVTDNGHGISKEMIDKIFQPFFTTKPSGAGTGLGLSISYDIVKAHGGELLVDSTEGKGSRFTLQLPFE